MNSASTTFDDFASDYNDALSAGLHLTGESQHYFLRRRLKETARRLFMIGLTPKSVLDFGCGCGDACPVILDELKAAQYVGLDVSKASLGIAAQRYGGSKSQFFDVGAFNPEAKFDIAYCNGVFHHIPPSARAASLEIVRGNLRNGGMFAFWENNPWNPGTRMVMRRIPFDRDAIPLSFLEGKRLLRQGGFEIVSTSFHFVFPRPLQMLRAVEPALCKLPLGGQYLILCRRT